MNNLSQILATLAGIIAAIAIVSIFTMLLWNWLMPEIFGLGRISYLQAFGLITLANLLFPSAKSYEKITKK